ncbi:hypothetical protein EV426DRAFT_706409 [Tirmania nivea]|nr:hypothetical protein EV426DRAFT_706409 [Tirmania nivea]
MALSVLQGIDKVPRQSEVKHISATREPLPAASKIGRTLIVPRQTRSVGLHLATHQRRPSELLAPLRPQGRLQLALTVTTLRRTASTSPSLPPSPLGTTRVRRDAKTWENLDAPIWRKEEGEEEWDAVEA